jgi:hypothetical protein
VRMNEQETYLVRAKVDILPISRFRFAFPIGRNMNNDEFWKTSNKKVDRISALRTWTAFLSVVDFIHS